MKNVKSMEHFLPLKWCTITSVRKCYSRNVRLNYNYVRVIAPLK
jgi:hypothetical protein